MEYRYLGASGFRVPALSFGTGTFGGQGDFFKEWGNTDAAGARRLLDVCLDAGVNMFDSADIYSKGAAESILGEAIKGRPRDALIISTKATFRFGDGENQVGSSRHHLINSLDAALRRLGTDYIDLFQLHGFDARTPAEEVLSTLDTFVRAGKIRYIGVSNFAGWQLMKSLAVADRYGWTRYVAHQAYYSLVGRDYLYAVVDALDAVAADTGRTVPQVALNWLLQRPTVATVIVGARNEEQLRQNLGAVGWSLTPEQVATLDAASAVTPPYPYWHQRPFAYRNPPAV